MTLFELPQGARAQVRALHGEVQNLTRFGICRGASLQVVFKSRYGVTVRVCGVRIGISKAAAKGVEVYEDIRAGRESQLRKKHPL